MVMEKVERALGLPSLNKVAQSLDKFPDAKQLKLIKDVLTVAERVAMTGPELEKIADLIREINSMPIEKLEKLERILRRIEGIMKKAPQELISFLTSLKEE